MTKTVYGFDENTGRFSGQVLLDDSDLSPLEPGVYLLPAGCTDVEPPAASDGQSLVWSGSAWQIVDPLPDPEPEPVDIQALKISKNDQINASRLVATYTSFEHGGKIIASDQLSRSDIDGINGYVALNNAFPAGWPGAWKAVDNTYLLISSVSEWKALYASMVAAGSANFAHAQMLKAAVADATTAEQVAAVVW